MAGAVIIRASAPVRLDFAGAWTDVAPYPAEAGGVVVNAAIGLRAEVTLEPGGTGHRLESRDLGEVLTIDRPDQLAPNGRLDLLKAAVRRFELPPCRLITRSEAPPGSGLGSSGALDVALVAAALAVAGSRATHPEEIAERAWELEAVEAGLPCGKQDQFAAALGGFHRFDFGEAVAIRPLRIDPVFADWLERHIVVCYTGQSRVSSDAVRRVVARYRGRDPVVVGALKGLRETAEAMAEALEVGDPAAVGRLLSANWLGQCALDAAMRTNAMARLEQAMGLAGSLGGKAAGAGVGGTMFFLMERDPVAAAGVAREHGATVLPLRWSAEGVRVW